MESLLCGGEEKGGWEVVEVRGELWRQSSGKCRRDLDADRSIEVRQAIVETKMKVEQLRKFMKIN
jgi:hypothetical protein